MLMQKRETRVELTGKKRQKGGLRDNKKSSRKLYSYRKKEKIKVVNKAARIRY